MVRKVAMNWSLHLITGLVIMPVLLGAYWLLWPYAPFRETGTPTVFTPSVKAGGALEVRRYICVEGHQYRANRRMIGPDGTQIVLTPESGVSRPGCYSRTVLVTIPDWAPAGWYDYHASLSYEVNPLRTVTIDLLPVRIEVTR